MEKEQNSIPKLSAEQEKLLKDLEEQLKKRKQEAKRLPKIIIALSIVLIIAALIYTCLRKPAQLPQMDGIAVHYIDVGQGDCIFVTGSGENMLIDCGEASQAETVIDYLERQGVKRLDCVIATHPHSDHMGGMSRIVESFDIGELIIPHLPDGDIPTTMYFRKFLDAVEKKKVTLKESVTGSKMTVCGGEWEFIAPVSESCTNGNNYSIGLILKYGRNSFIFTGDAETSAEKEMLSTGRVSRADVYKAPHHGSDTSSSDEFLKAIDPEIVVISVGAGNSYGHPHKSTMDKLKKYTDKIYRTDLDGTVIIQSDGEDLTVRTERSSR